MVMERERWLAMDAAGYLSLPLQMAGFKLGLFSREVQRQGSLLQLLNKISRMKFHLIVQVNHQLALSLMAG